MNRILWYLVSSIFTGCVFLISLIYYAVHCQFGCEDFDKPAIYSSIVAWLFLMLFVFCLAKLIRLIYIKLKTTKLQRKD